MDEEPEEEILLSKAGSDELTPEEARRWRELCDLKPQLRQKEAELREAHAFIEARITEELLENLESEPMPQSVRAAFFAKLAEDRTADELATKNRHASSEAPAHGEDASSETGVGLGAFFSWLMRGGAGGPALVGGLALVCVLAGGWWWWNQWDDQVPRLAQTDPETVYKRAIESDDLPILSPAARTHLLDPIISWSSFGADTADVEILDPGTGEVLLQGSGLLPPVAWGKLQVVEGSRVPAKGAVYRVRIRKGEAISERLVTIEPDAVRTEQALEAPDAALDLAAEWLEEYPADALSLLQALERDPQRAGTVPPDRLERLRTEALGRVLDNGL